MSALDTSGAVPTTDRSFWGGVVKWSDISPFTQGYIEAALRALDEQRMAHYQDRRARGLPQAVPIRPAYSWLARETLARIIADCEAADHLRPGVTDDGDRSAGRGLWELRQSGAYADRFPPLTVQLGDDGKVRFAQ